MFRFRKTGDKPRTNGRKGRAGQTGRGRTGRTGRKILKIVVFVPAILFLMLLGSVVSLRWINPPVTSFTLLEDWDSLNRDRHNLRDYWVPPEQLPDHLRRAVIASEDQRFMEHFGLDLEAIESAMEEGRGGGRQRGASTITQQVAKNLYLWPGQSWLRKGLEAGIAVMIEVAWSKDRIMEMYLNIAEFGPGLYGSGIATSVWFGKSTTELSREESARMAAVLSSPKRMRVEPPSPYTIERSRWILGQMENEPGPTLNK